MSDTLTAIHAQTSAILETLFAQRGQPRVLNDDFIKEYFKRVKDQVDQLDLDDDEDEDEPKEPKTPHATNAKLSQTDRGLVDVTVTSKAEKFLVSTLTVGE
jgi:hypothetical protein